MARQLVVVCTVLLHDQMTLRIRTLIMARQLVVVCTVLLHDQMTLRMKTLIMARQLVVVFTVLLHDQMTLRIRTLIMARQLVVVCTVLLHDQITLRMKTLIIGTFRSLRFTVGWPLKSCTHTVIFPSVSGHPTVKRKPRKVPNGASVSGCFYGTAA